MSKLHKILTRRKPKSDWVIVFQAVVTVAAVLAAAVFLFEYHNDIPLKKQQHTVMSRIPDSSAAIWNKQLDMRDPARLFGMGGFSALRPARSVQKEFRILPEKITFPELPQGKYRAVTEYPFPVSASFAQLIQKTNISVKRGTVVVSPRGEIIHLNVLDQAVAPDVPSGKTILNLSGRGEMRRFRIIESCGAADFDMRGGDAVKEAGLPNGTYTVIWSKGLEAGL
ncbi:MAG: hypothetical protein IKA71_06730 [Lentisphaeria bacterium]|nr:hypothetical protein [Lentisphaeria bacterium]